MFLPVLIAAALVAPAPPPQAASPASQAAATPENAFVQADVLRVRSEPRADAPIVARLRIGTPVKLGDLREPWIRIAYRNADGWVEGWASRALLGGHALTHEEALSLASSSDGPERISWLERAAAIAPGSAGTWKALAEALEKAGLEDRARSARAMLRGEQPGFLVFCAGGRAALLAEWMPGRRLRPLSGEFLTSGEDGEGPLPQDGAALRLEQERLAAELPAVAFHRLDGRSLPASPFPQPRPKRESGALCPTYLSVEMGSCAGAEPWLATTTPLEPSTTKAGAVEPRLAAALAARGGITATRTAVRLIAGPHEFTEVQFEASSETNTTADNSKSGRPRAEKRRFIGWALFGSSPEPAVLQVMEVVAPDQTVPEGVGFTTSIGPASWSRLPLQPGVRLAAIPWSAFIAETAPENFNGMVVAKGGFWLVTIDATGQARLTDLDPHDFPPRCLM